jgi:uncharacterized protein YjaZ
LLFGFERYPSMMGYSFGYYLISQFKKQKSFSEKTYFLLKSENFVNENFKKC